MPKLYIYFNDFLPISENVNIWDMNIFDLRGVGSCEIFTFEPSSLHRLDISQPSLPGLSSLARTVPVPMLVRARGKVRRHNGTGPWNHGTNTNTAQTIYVSILPLLLSHVKYIWWNVNHHHSSKILWFLNIPKIVLTHSTTWGSQNELIIN